MQTLYRFLGAPNYFLVGKDGRLLVTDSHSLSELIREADKRLSAPDQEIR